MSGIKTVGGELMLPPAFVSRGRPMRGGRLPDGRVWMQVDGRDRITMTPRDAFDVARNLLAMIGIKVDVEFE